VEPEGGGGAMSAAGPRVVPFQGRAYRLGDPSTQSEVIEGPQVHQKRKVSTLLYVITSYSTTVLAGLLNVYPKAFGKYIKFRFP